MSSLNWICNETHLPKRRWDDLAKSIIWSYDTIDSMCTKTHEIQIRPTIYLYIWNSLNTIHLPYHRMHKKRISHMMTRLYSPEYWWVKFIKKMMKKRLIKIIDEKNVSLYKHSSDLKGKLKTNLNCIIENKYWKFVSNFGSNTSKLEVLMSPPHQMTHIWWFKIFLML